jgi:hypothetical protein
LQALHNVGQTFCNESYRLGQFSSLCVSNGYTETSIFVVFADFCTVPYSFGIYTISKSLEHFQKITASKINKGIEFIKNNKECGVHVKITSKGEEIYEVQLGQICRNNELGELLIHDLYKSDLGLFCPVDECRQLGSGKNIGRSCSTPWIIGDELINVQTTINSIKICENEQMNVTFSYDGGNTTFVLNRSLQPFYLASIDRFDYKEGYIDINGGNISLYIDHNFQNEYRFTVSKCTQFRLIPFCRKLSPLSNTVLTLLMILPM